MCPGRLLASIFFAFILSIAAAGPIGASETARGGRFYEPVEVPGEILGSLVGKSIAGLGVYSWKNGRWRPVLHQVDERTPEGNFILTRGPESNPGLADGLFNRRDLIVFMARDSGEKAPENEKPPGADLSVGIELIDPMTGVNSWTYIAWFEKGAPEIELDPISMVIDGGDEFKFRFLTSGYDAVINHREKKAIPTIYIDRLWIDPDAGGSGENIIDRQKVRGEISFLGGLVKVPINEKIVSGGIVAYKPGPVRILTHSCMYPLFPMGIKGPKFYIDVILVDTMTLTAIMMDVPFDPGFLIHELILEFGMDLTPSAKGMKYYNSINQSGVLIDGKTDRREEKFDTTKDQWRLITGPQGTQIISTRFDEKFLADGSVHSTYNDNENDSHPPENFPGDIGAASDGLVIKSLDPGAYKIEVTGYLPHHFYDPEGLNHELLEDILSIQTSPLEIRVNDIKAGNRGALPRIVMSR